MLCLIVYISTNTELKITTALQNYTDKRRHHSTVFLLDLHFIVSFYIIVTLCVNYENILITWKRYSCNTFMF
jgi:hypothetical protein